MNDDIASIAHEITDRLPVGTAVRVYRTGPSSPTFFYDPETGKVTEFSLAEFVVGVVREIHRNGESYRVTVLRNNRELYVNWMSRHWLTPVGAD